MHLLEDDGFSGAPLNLKQDDVVMNQESMRIDPQTYLKSLLHFLQATPIENRMSQLLSSVALQNTIDIT